MMENFQSEYFEDDLREEEQEREKRIQSEGGRIYTNYLQELCYYGNVRAMLELGKYFLKDKTWVEHASEWLGLAAETGCKEAIDLLDQIPEEKRYDFGPKTDEGRKLLERARNGEPEAMLLLGDEYGDGINFPESYSLSIYWYRQAAGAGIPRALYNMAAKCSDIDRHYADAGAEWERRMYRWREKAVLAGHPRALAWQAEDYCMFGRDSEKGIELYRRAVEGGCEDALFPLWHFERDTIEPEHWEVVKQQAEQGDPEAQCFLATRYYLTGRWPFFRFYNVPEALK